MTASKTFRATAVLAALAVLAPPLPAGAQGTGLANPASVNCTRQGGGLQIERRGDGGAFGVCRFADDRQCEEWAMLRGDCPVGGLRVTGFVTPAARYCALTGGRYTIVAHSGSADEVGVCALPGGRTCPAADYWAGRCPR